MKLALEEAFATLNPKIPKQPALPTILAGAAAGVALTALLIHARFTPGFFLAAGLFLQLTLGETSLGNNG